MKELLVNLLESFGYPVYLQGTLHEEVPYPEHFFTYFNNDTSDLAHYDNSTVDFEWNFDVMFYSIDPELVLDMCDRARKLLKQNGFVIPGKGFDVMSDEPTHTGRGFTALIRERQEEKNYA